MKAQQVTDLGEWRHNHSGTITAAQPPVVVGAAVQWAQPQTGGQAEIVLGETGPAILWAGSDPQELQVMAMAFLDAARAVRNGDDLNEVARQEWRRRGGQPELD